jgi:Domain of unknown function (DUF4158)
LWEVRRGDFDRADGVSAFRAGRVGWRAGGAAPLVDGVEWASQRSRSDEHLLGLVPGLKCFQRLGYFSRDDQLPEAVVERIRASLGLTGGVVRGARDRTARWQQELVRDRLGVLPDPERARALAEQAIREEAQVKNDPPDLINVALEVLVREALELPGFSTLNEMAARVRAKVNEGMFAGILARMSQGEVLRINGLLEVVGCPGRAGLTR